MLVHVVQSVFLLFLFSLCFLVSVLWLLLIMRASTAPLRSRHPSQPLFDPRSSGKRVYFEF